MPLDKQTKQELPYNSIFVADLKIDIANFVTETLIKNGLEQYKKALPNVAFWQKDIARVNTNLQNLHDRYIHELPEVRKYLKVFSPSNLLETINKNKYNSLFYLDKATRQTFVYELYLNQLRHVKTMEDTKSIETMDIKDFTKTPQLLNTRKKIGL